MNTEQLAALKSLLDSAVSSIDESTEKTNKILNELLDTVIRLRRLRNSVFPANYFADTAWDILLDLYEAKIENNTLCTTALAVDSAAPLATVLRYLKTLEKDGYIERFADDQDGRRTMVQLTEKGEKAMQDTFSQSLSRRSPDLIRPFQVEHLAGDTTQ